MSSNEASSTQPSKTLPILAIVFFFAFWPVGVILAIVSIATFGGDKGSTAKTLSIVALVMNLALVPMCGVVGVLAAIAVPNFVKFQCRSKQSEAKGNLKALYVAEESFRAENDRYDRDFAALQFTPKGQKIRYTYTVLPATNEAFAAEARGIGEMEGDVWTIDNANAITNVESRCAR